MKLWTQRPMEEAYLLNPAFCSTILTAAISGYSQSQEEGIPYPLAFMVLPIVLHKPTRDLLPPNTRTSMAAWLQDNSGARILFYERLVSLKPYTREAIQFGMLLNWIVPKPGALLGTVLKGSEINRAINRSTNETHDCLIRARFLGKWFAAAGATHMVMAFWGIRP